jgi:hypothetical protein
MKTFPNRDIYHQILRAMTPEQKLLKSFELSELAENAYKAGLKHRHQSASEEELNRLYLESKMKCHKRNY